MITPVLILCLHIVMFLMQHVVVCSGHKIWCQHEKYNHASLFCRSWLLLMRDFILVELLPRHFLELSKIKEVRLTNGIVLDLHLVMNKNENCTYVTFNYSFIWIYVAIQCRHANSLKWRESHAKYSHSLSRMLVNLSRISSHLLSCHSCAVFKKKLNFFWRCDCQI